MRIAEKVVQKGFQTDNVPSCVYLWNNSDDDSDDDWFGESRSELGWLPWR